MQRILVIAGSVALGSLSALLLAGAWAMTEVAVEVHRSPEFLLKAEATLDYAGRAAKHVDEAAGVWADTSRTEAKYLNEAVPALTAEAHATMRDADGLLVSLHQTSDTAGIALSGAQALEAHADEGLQRVLAQAAVTLHSADALVADPHIKASLDHIDVATAAGADGVKQADAILQDARATADKYGKRRPWLLRLFGF